MSGNKFIIHDKGSKSEILGERFSERSHSSDLSATVLT